MPRKARIDAPGAIHHVIGRGINRREIFSDKKDYLNFLERLGDLLHQTKTAYYAWALMPNNFHLLLRTGAEGFDFERISQHVAEIAQLTKGQILDRAREKRRTEARSMLVYWATDQLGMTQTQLAEKRNLTQSAVSHASRRGKILVDSNRYLWQ